jgi:hypothetical protein
MSDEYIPYQDDDDDDEHWYRQDKHILHDLTRDGQNGVSYFCGHARADGSWEYAIVWWLYRSCTLQYLIHNGVVTRKDA